VAQTLFVDTTVLRETSVSFYNGSEGSRPVALAAWHRHAVPRQDAMRQAARDLDPMKAVQACGRSGRRWSPSS